jgi:multidrug efflux pump subunit AcrA (membrane-fusion protein)
MACLLLILVPSAMLSAGDTALPATKPAPPAIKPATVHIADCRIVLIDHVMLACDRPGILKAVECKEGQRVMARQELIVIADEVARANLAVAERKGGSDVEVRFQKKACELAEVEYRKNAEANQKAVEAGKGTPVAPLEVEKLRLTAEKAALAIEQAEHELLLDKLNADVARAELATFSVVAEFEGVVTRVFRKKGEAVHQGDPIVELINPDRVRIEGRIGLPHLKFARQGGMVKVKLTVPDLDLPEEREEFEGRITFVDLVSDPVTHETRVFAEVENRENILRAGLMAEMILEPGSK